jgi:hypothetical protein
VLYRVAATLIVLFWFTMTALLIRNEVRPGDSRLRELPVSHVMRLLFLHAQPSELDIHYEKSLVGRLRVHPQVRAEDDARLVELAGNLHLSAPGMDRQRLVTDCTLELTRQLELRRVRVAFSVREPSPYRIEIMLDLPAKRGRYELRTADRLVDAREYPLDQSGAQALLDQLEIAPELAAFLRSARTPDPLAVTARQSTLPLHGAPLDTYLVTIRQNAQTLLEAHISQLGQILRATTLLGYTLSAEGVGEG